MQSGMVEVNHHEWQEPNHETLRNGWIGHAKVPPGRAHPHAVNRIDTRHRKKPGRTLAGVWWSQVPVPQTTRRSV